MLKIFLFSFFILSTSIYAQDHSKWTEKDYWQTTRITFERTLYGEINDKSCLENGQEYFVGCMYALSAGITLAKKDGSFHSVMPALQTTVGFEIRKIKQDDLEEHKAYKKALREWYKTYTKTPMSKPLGISMLYAAYKETMINSSNEAYLTASIYNHFLAHAYDPHTYINSNSKYEDTTRSSNISRGIFGFTFPLTIFRGNERHIIDYITPGSSASKSKLTTGDVILSVNGKTNNEDIVKELKNENRVKLNVIGPKGEKSITLERQEVKIDVVFSELLKSPEGRFIGYLKLSHFMDPQGCEKITFAGEELIKQGAEAIILDLRNNGGGLVNVARCINSQFLEKKSLEFVEEDLRSKRFTGYTNLKDTGIFRNIQSVVLINANSASASEIVSIYLQAYRKAFIVGENSFGKGTMQSGTTYYEGYLKFQTIAKYYGPHMVSPQLQGVIPDIEASLRYGHSEKNAIRERDLYENAIKNAPVEVPVMEERIQEIALIKDCIKDDQVELRSFEKKNEFAQLIHDNQKTVGLATLDCAIKNNIPIFKKIKIPVNDY